MLLQILSPGWRQWKYSQYYKEESLIIVRSYRTLGPSTENTYQYERQCFVPIKLLKDTSFSQQGHFHFQAAACWFWQQSGKSNFRNWNILSYSIIFQQYTTRRHKWKRPILFCWAMNKINYPRMEFLRTSPKIFVWDFQGVLSLVFVGMQYEISTHSKQRAQGLLSAQKESYTGFICSAEVHK